MIAVERMKPCSPPPLFFYLFEQPRSHVFCPGAYNVSGLCGAFEADYPGTLEHAVTESALRGVLVSPGVCIPRPDAPAGGDERGKCGVVCLPALDESGVFADRFEPFPAGIDATAPHRTLDSAPCANASSSAYEKDMQIGNTLLGRRSHGDT
ncbi:hypothetical protein MRX96_021460 [Rhipicephalus microplus]